MASARVGMSRSDSVVSLRINESVRVRRRGASVVWVGFGAFVGTALGAAIWEIRNDRDSSGEMSAWKILWFTGVGAALGFMGSSK